MKLQLYYPAKPYRITQAFGIFNPSYQRFGFSRHNGIDFAVDADGIVRAMCDGVIVETGDKPTGAGIYLRLRTLTRVEAEGNDDYVEFFYMHAKELLVKKGQKVSAGDALIIADNTGFSTGPHTHISAYFVDPEEMIGQHKLPLGDKESDYCFDFSKYYNGRYSDDLVEAALKQIVTLYQKIINLLLKK